MSGSERLDSNITLGTKNLQGVVGDVDRVLGYAIIYTVGDAVIPRDWLLMRMDELGLPDYMAPPQPRPSSAYKRAARRLLSDSNMQNSIRELNKQTSRDVEVELENPEDAGTYLRIIEVKEYVNEAESGSEGGRYLHHQIGFFDYDTDTQGIRAVGKLHQLDLSESNLTHNTMKNLWDVMTSRMRAKHDEMREHNLGDDLLNYTLYNLTHKWTNTVVPLRDGGAVYFVPADLSGVVDSLSTLLSDVNSKFKKSGRRMALNTIPMVDDQQHREWVQERVEQQLEKAVDDVVDAAFEELEDDDSTAQDIVRSIMNNLGDAGETASQYNSLLEAQLNVEDILERKKQELKDKKKQDIVDKVLKKQGVGGN